jgi:hypothetical protein
VVEAQEDHFYLLHFGGGERRWASAGELAWHDCPPLGHDLLETKQIAALDCRVAAFVDARVVGSTRQNWQVAGKMGIGWDGMRCAGLRCGVGLGRKVR